MTAAGLFKLPNKTLRWDNDAGGFLVEVTPKQLAEAFADMHDEGQAQFFIEVAAIASGWEGGNFPQWYMVGRHLARCACSTDEARSLIREIAQGASAS